jgi:NADPH-dependent 2,4-dienoyl-CoA reductase/sulfur reductase-like enzyme
VGLGIKNGSTAHLVDDFIDPDVFNAFLRTCRDMGNLFHQSEKLKHMAQEKKPKKVIVVGGGLAGLSAAMN